MATSTRLRAALASASASASADTGSSGPSPAAIVVPILLVLAAAVGIGFWIRLMRRRRRAQSARAAKAISWSTFGETEPKRGDADGDVSVTMGEKSIDDAPPSPPAKDTPAPRLPPVRPTSAFPFPTTLDSPVTSHLRPISRATTVSRPYSGVIEDFDDDDLPPPSPALPGYYATLMNPGAMTGARNSVATMMGEETTPARNSTLRPPVPSP